MASLNFELEKQIFIEFYDANLTKLLGFRERMVTALQDLVKDLPESDGFMVSGRIKDRNECLEKFIRKYKNLYEENSQVYTIQDSISDLVGFRIVCIYINQIDSIKEALIGEFQMLEETDKIKQIQATENTFGYQALHMDMKLSPDYLGRSYYRQFPDIKFEIQIRTIIQDSWSVVDHKIKYKKEIPLVLKRKINVLSALFELADREFMTIKNENTVFLQAAEKIIFDDIINQKSSTLSLDTVALTGFLWNKFPDVHFKIKAIERFFNELRTTNTELSLADLIVFYETNFAMVLQFQSENNLNFNAFTFLRHIFYLANQSIYRPLLQEYQITALNRWLENKKPPP